MIPIKLLTILISSLFTLKSCDFGKLTSKIEEPGKIDLIEGLEKSIQKLYSKSVQIYMKFPPITKRNNPLSRLRIELQRNPDQKLKGFLEKDPNTDVLEGALLDHLSDAVSVLEEIKESKGVHRELNPEFNRVINLYKKLVSFDENQEKASSDESSSPGDRPELPNSPED